MTRNIRFLRPRDLAALALLLHGCIPAEPTGEVEQAGTVSQGTVSQGTVSQGTVSQGTVSQGSQNAVWGFRYTDWWNSGMRLKDTGVVEGHLVATWDRTEDCGSPGLGGPSPLGRSCGWYGAGWATCISGTTVTVGAGACGLGWSSADSMIRVCKGDKPCPADAALAANDDTAAGSGCNSSNRPAARFTCPATPPGIAARFFVMVGPKSGEPLFSYAVATSGTLLPQTFQTKLADGPCAKCGSQFVGTTLGGLSGTGEDPVTYRIAAVKVEDASTSFYTLRQQVDDTPLCLDASPPQRDERAVPMPGRWGANGRFVNTPDSFTFACTAGVIAKCYVHGYRPWALNADGESLRDYHQTCTRAMRADYCGDGGSQTVTGTMIDLYDRRAHAAQDTTWDHPHEAIWRRDLATLEPPVVPRGPVACLAKQRWETIPLGGCAELTPDPRINDKRADYCDEYPIQGGWFSDDLSDPHLIANKSAFIDAGLWRWRRLDGQELRSTTTLPTTEPQLLDPAYLFSPSQHEPVLLGSVYALKTSDGVRPQHVIKLYSYLHPTTKDYLTTTDPAPPGYDDHGVEEGWILAPACATTPGCPTTKPLGLYRNAATGDSATDTSAPTGYQLVKVLGYLPR